MEFIEWLEKEKGLSKKSSHDVASRFKRLQKITNIDDIKTMDIDKIEKNSNFTNLSVSVKSQLRRSLVLMDEYSKL